MSNPINQFETLTGPQLLEEWGDFLAGKVDKRGGVVPAEGSNKRLSAQWMNLVDDLIIAVANGSISGGATSEIINNTASPEPIGFIGPGDSDDFHVDIETDRDTLEMLWWSVTRSASEPAYEDLRLEAFSRSTRTPQNLIFTAELPVNPGTPILDTASTAGHGLLFDPFANALDEIDPGFKRIYFRIFDIGTTETTENLQFAYVVRAFDTGLTTITEQ